MSAVVRVLIADDHPVVRSGIRGMLASDAGFEVVGEAADGTEAVAMTLRERPDVVLMDLRMPDLDGPALYRELAACAPDLARRMVLVTGDVLTPQLRAELQASLPR